MGKKGVEAYNRFLVGRGKLGGYLLDRWSCTHPISQPQPFPQPSQITPCIAFKKNTGLPWQRTHVVSALEAGAGSTEGWLTGGTRRSWKVRADSHPPSSTVTLTSKPQAEAVQSS